LKSRAKNTLEKKDSSNNKLFNFSIPRLVVSGLRGGSGKTILSLSLIALWRKKGLKIIPFKKGPDYIDAGWLAKAACTPCYNLDLFMMSPEQVVQSFISHTNPPKSPHTPLWKRGAGGDLKGGQEGIIAIIEGNRGLYDGVDHRGTYSTAELAKLLKTPVIMIIECTKSTNTIAAMVLGCQKMDPEVSINGVVLNQVATSRQELLIRKAINGKCKLPVLGAIPRLEKDPFPERHMGLIPFQEHQDIDRAIAIVEEIGAKYLDMDGIWRIAEEAVPISERQTSEDKKLRRWEDKKLSTSQPLNISSSQIRPSSLKIGVIRDSAFQFYYPENLEELEKRGAKLIEVSPLRERKLPRIDALYIGGGFPETYAIALAENVSFKHSLREAIEKGLPVYAECGGLMYLGESLVLKDKTYLMVGVFPIVFGLEKRPQAHGYTIVEIEKTNPYFLKKTILKGHEFHYSCLKSPQPPKSPHIPLWKRDNPPKSPFIKGGLEGDFKGRQRGFRKQKDNIYFAFRMKRGQGIVDKMDGICYKNVLATYTHLHAIGASEWADGLIRCAREFKVV
jgi:cobyrinic acid a,c-diamide synthase